MPIPDEVAITNVLYRYAEMIDAGQFEAMADQLFAHAHCIVAPPPAPPIDGAAMCRLIARTTIRYEDGTPRTKHVLTNPIVEVADDGDHATCRSYYTVFQQVGDGPLHPVVSGRYHDRFGRIDGRWWFTERDYTMIDLVGDTSRHLSMAPPSGK